MFALPSDYVTAQNAGKTFAADYYGRLNVSAESVTDLFTECSRYYSMDSLNGRPTVGRSGAIREVRRFLSTYRGGRRFVKVVSMDAQIDGDERAEKNFGSDDDYVFDHDDYGEHDGDQHLAVFVHAELTDPKRPSLAPLPFVQTFLVRWLRTADRGDLFEIVITVVKTMRDAVQQQHQLQHRHRLSDDNHSGFSNSGCVENDYETTRGPFKQGTYYAGNTKQLNAEDREFELWSDVTSPSTDDEEQEPSEGGQLHSNSSMREEFLAYLKKVDEFLEKPTVDSDDNVDDDVGPTDRLRVDYLDKSITADQLYAAFSHYGKVLWVRVLPYDYNCSSQYHSARVCFDRNESVDRVMADYHGSGCTIGGVRVSFSRSRLDQ